MSWEEGDEERDLARRIADQTLELFKAYLDERESIARSTTLGFTPSRVMSHYEAAQRTTNEQRAKLAQLHLEALNLRRET